MNKNAFTYDSQVGYRVNKNDEIYVNSSPPGFLQAVSLSFWNASGCLVEVAQNIMQDAASTEIIQFILGINTHQKLDCFA